MSMDKVTISGFADEISQSFDEQLQVVTDLGMKYICIRSAEGKGIADYTPQEMEETLLPRMKKARVGVSSLGSAIGKIPLDDQEAFETQVAQLENLCQLCKVLECRYIRVFSFYPPKGEDPNTCGEQVLEKLKVLIQIAEKNDVILIHENEKGIFGDTGDRCKYVMDTLGGPHFKAAFDFANFVQCGEDPEKCWDQLQAHIAYIHVKDAVPNAVLNVPAGTGDGKIPQLLRRAIREEGYTGFLTLEPHLAMFNFFGAKPKVEGDKPKSPMENNPFFQKLKEEMAQPGRPKNGAEAYAIQYNALQDILGKI